MSPSQMGAQGLVPASAPRKQGFGFFYYKTLILGMISAFSGCLFSSMCRITVLSGLG